MISVFLYCPPTKSVAIRLHSASDVIAIRLRPAFDVIGSYDESLQVL